MVGGELCPLSLIPGDAGAALRNLGWSDVAVIKIQDTQVHLCLVVLLGPRRPGPASG